MGLYSKPSLALLGELINRDNPGLKTTLTPDNFMLLNGPFVTGTNQRNTRVVINGITGSGLVGKKEFYYDRMNIGQLFNGITVVFKAEGSSAKISDLLPSLNEQYGIALEKSDISNADAALTTGYQPTQVTLNISTECPVYVGTLNIFWSRIPVGEYPNSGPGSKIMLVGDLETGGYFGKVSADEMLSASSIFSQLLADGNNGESVPASTENLFWIKFAYKGKFLFYPSAILATTNWALLYSRGSVYGDETTGNFPPAGATLRKQDAVLVFNSPTGTSAFRPRLPTFHALDPAPAERSGTGELGQLIWRVFKGSYSKGDWDTLDLGIGPGLFDATTNQIWQNSRETQDENGHSVVWVTSPSAAATTSTPKTRAQPWRPFLELIDLAQKILPVSKIGGQATGVLTAPVFTIDTARDPAMPIRVINVTGAYKRTIEVPVANTAQISPITAGKNLTFRNALSPIAMSITVNVTKKMSLASTNGELDGFK